MSEGTLSGHAVTGTNVVRPDGATDAKDSTTMSPTGEG